MTKPISKIHSRRDGHTGLHKNVRRMSKGVTHLQTSFNNIIVTAIDARGLYGSGDFWSFAGTCGFKGARRGTTFAAQNGAGNITLALFEEKDSLCSVSSGPSWKKKGSYSSFRLHLSLFGLSVPQDRPF